MRLIEVEVEREFKPSVDQLQRLHAAIAYPTDIKLEVYKEEDCAKYEWMKDHVGRLQGGLTFLVSAPLMPLDIPHSVKRVILDSNAAIPGLDTETEKRSPAFNKCVNVIVPGLGLLAITEVKVRNNLCTDDLGGELKDGWRILAICVQPDQRRPDYVLGRSREEID